MTDMSSVAQLLRQEDLFRDLYIGQVLCRTNNHGVQIKLKILSEVDSAGYRAAIAYYSDGTKTTCKFAATEMWAWQ